VLDGRPIDLLGLAREVCARYATEFPDERGRYGEAGAAWCVHDNQHILNWGVLAVEWEHDINRDLEWLARVLASRDFPVARLVRDLEIAAEVVEARLGTTGSQLAERLRSGAEFVRALPGPAATRAAADQASS